MATRRVTLREAADILGVSKEAVRKRVIRGTLRSDTGADGRRYVYLDAGGDEPPTHEPDALISEMRSRIQFLEDELQRKDAILLNMTEAMKALSPPSQEPPPDERESPETVDEQQGRGQIHPDAPGAQEGAEHSTEVLKEWSGDVQGARRPWWRRLLGR